jgi:hypothetical protein
MANFTTTSVPPVGVPQTMVDNLDGTYSLQVAAAVTANSAPPTIPPPPTVRC